MGRTARYQIGLASVGPARASGTIFLALESMDTSISIASSTDAYSNGKARSANNFSQVNWN